jgi:hypothetical protein
VADLAERAVAPATVRGAVFFGALIILALIVYALTGFWHWAGWVGTIGVLGIPLLMWTTRRGAARKFFFWALAIASVLYAVYESVSPGVFLGTWTLLWTFVVAARDVPAIESPAATPDEAG